MGKKLTQHKEGRGRGTHKSSKLWVQGPGKTTAGLPVITHKAKLQLSSFSFTNITRESVQGFHCQLVKSANNLSASSNMTQLLKPAQRFLQFPHLSICTCVQ